MRKYALICLCVLCLLFQGCGKRRYIPAGTLSRIYAEMFIADQWSLSNSESRRQSDTTLFYEPIFNKYGYTTDDFQRTVSHYLYKPEKYKRIMVRAHGIISKQLEQTRKELEWSERNMSSDQLEAAD